MRVISNILYETTNLAHSGVKMGITFIHPHVLLSAVTRLVLLHLIQLDTTFPSTVLSQRNTE